MTRRRPDPATRQDSDSETQTGEYYDPDRRPDEFANFIGNNSLSDTRSKIPQPNRIPIADLPNLKDKKARWLQ